MTMSYTPGPWEIKLYPYPSRRRGKPCIGISSRHARDFIAQYIRSDADARLIATAPDMAESLRKLVVHCTNYAAYLKTLGPEFKETCMRVQDDIAGAASTLRLINGEE